MIFLIDAKNLLFRSQFAHDKLTTQDGRPSGCIYGFLSSIRMLKKSLGSGRFIVCWENGCLLSSKIERVGPSWRQSLFPEYKMNRVHNNEEGYKQALAQVPIIIELLDCMGLHQIEVGGLEADDLISLLAANTEDKCIVYSYDADLFQLLTLKNVLLARPSAAKYEFFTAQDVEKKHNVHPREWTRYRALMGDASDNIKVLKGVGPVKALAYLRQGLDPSVRDFSQLSPDLQKTFVELEPLWKKLHNAWRISELPKRVAQLPIQPKQQVILSAFLNQTLHGYPTLDPVQIRMKSFMSLLADWDMREFIGTVHKFFS